MNKILLLACVFLMGCGTVAPPCDDDLCMVKIIPRKSIHPTYVNILFGADIYQGYTVDTIPVGKEFEILYVKSGTRLMAEFKVDSYFMNGTWLDTIVTGYTLWDLNRPIVF